MKTQKLAAKSGHKKSSARVRDLKPAKNPKAGIGLLLPAVQKVRSAAHTTLSYRS